MRHLVSIQKIWKIEPIANADRIELASVMGWKCVVPKGQFHEMEDAVYFEIDSFLPMRPEFEFLHNSSYKKSDILGEGYRLRTQTFRGQISQGLLLPISTFPELKDSKLYDDVTELLGVRKYEIGEKATDGGTIVGERPDFIPKTDETRVQEVPELINCFAGKPYYITTKMDGSSHSVGIDADGKFWASGHRFVYAEDGKSRVWDYLRRNDVELHLRKYMQDHSDVHTIVLQGEYCAPGIEGNRIGLSKAHWFVFTVIINGERLGLSDDKSKDWQAVARECGCELVPIVEKGEAFPYKTVDEILDLSAGVYKDYDNMKQIRAREGIVIRPQTPERCDLIDGEWLSMKAVNNKYLLKARSKEQDEDE